MDVVPSRRNLWDRAGRGKRNSEERTHNLLELGAIRNGCSTPSTNGMKGYHEMTVFKAFARWNFVDAAGEGEKRTHDLRVEPWLTLFKAFVQWH